MKLFLKKTSVIIWLFIVLCTVFTGCGRTAPLTRKVDTAMGTIVSQTLYSSQGTDLAEEILREIRLLEEECLSWRMEGSEVYAVNAGAGLMDGVAVSEELVSVLQDCRKVSAASAGAFDITVGKVVRLWDIDSWAAMEDASDFVMPKEEQLQDALADTGYDKISLEANYIVLPARLQLDMGAVGKGIALDKVRNVLDDYEVEGAVISVGGSILTYGSKPEGGAWNVAIVNPHDTSQNIGVLKLVGEWCVSTSGNYERYVEKDGVRYHHIINPKTGYPADSGISSVTILCKEGLYSDALSTACFILGEEEGRKLASEFGAEALFVSNSGEIIMTPGMEQYFHLSNKAN